MNTYFSYWLKTIFWGGRLQTPHLPFLDTRLISNIIKNKNNNKKKIIWYNIYQAKEIADIRFYKIYKYQNDLILF